MQGFNFSMPIDYMFENNQVEKVYFGSIKMWPRFDLKYLTIHSLDDNNIITFSLNDSAQTSETCGAEDVYYSLDNGITWNQLLLTYDGTSYSGSVIINNEDRLLLKMVNTHIGNRAHISASENYKVYGNIMSIGCGDNFRNITEIPNICKNLYFGIFSEGVPMPDLDSVSPDPTATHSLINAKHLALPTTTLTDRCYDSMFDGCTLLENGPEELPATTLTRWCYDQMFKYCHSLQKAPELPATTLPYACYDRMFYDCSSLTTAPELPAPTLTMFCYFQMFKGCTSLNYIKCLATDISATDCTLNWVDSVSSTGTFIKDVSMQNWTIGVDGIPNGWTIQDYSTYEDEYFTIEAINNNTQISFLARGSISSNLTDKLEYSLDDGATWNNFTTIIDVSGHPATDLMTLNSGDRIMLKAQNLGVYTEGSGNSNGTFTILTSNAGYYNVSGNIMSLVYGDNFRDKKSLAGLPSYYFANLFNPLNYQHNLVDVSNLILPATTLSDYCYYRMFNLCHQLTTAPMLPATTLADYCYYCMFSGCTSLTTAPSLPATTLADYCYLGMFDGCSNLSHITCLATDISASGCTDSWTDGVSQTGTFVKSPNMSNWTTGINGIPSGWNIQNAS